MSPSACHARRAKIRRFASSTKHSHEATTTHEHYSFIQLQYQHFLSVQQSHGNLETLANPVAGSPWLAYSYSSGQPSATLDEVSAGHESKK